MKEIERTFNINLTQKPPIESKILDPFVNDNKPIIDKITSKYIGVNKQRSATYQKSGQSQIFSNDITSQLNTDHISNTTNVDNQIDMLYHTKRNVIQQSRERKQQLLKQLDSKRGPGSLPQQSTGFEIMQENQTIGGLGITGQTAGIYIPQMSSVEARNGLALKSYRIQQQSEQYHMDQQRRERIQSHNPSYSIKAGESTQLLQQHLKTSSSFLKIEGQYGSVDQYENRGPPPSLQRPARIVQRPVIQSQNFQKVGQQSVLDIATRRRHIAALRAKNDQMQMDVNNTIYNSVEGGIPPISRAHTNQINQSEVLNNSQPLCQNGFKGMQDFPQYQNPQTEVTGTTDNASVTNSLTGAQRIKTQYQHLIPATSIASNKISQNMELTQDLSMAAGVTEQPGVQINDSQEKDEEQQEEPEETSKQPETSRITQTNLTLDYMFILMSNEQFHRAYKDIKVIIKPKFGEDNHEVPVDKQLPAHSPPAASVLLRGPAPQRILGADTSPKTIMSPAQERANKAKMSGPDLNGLVCVKPFESQYTNEVPSVSCHLTATHIDYLKILQCKEENKSHLKLTADASDKLEIEKQTQVKKYMEDIIEKLSAKNRRHKVTYKKKFIEEALQAQHQPFPEKRSSQVYVIVINREKDYDPVISQKMYKVSKRIRPAGIRKTKNNSPEAKSSSGSEDNAGPIVQKETSPKVEMIKATTRLKGVRKSEIEGAARVNQSGMTKYASDNESGGIIMKYQTASKNNTERLSSAATCSSQPMGLKNGLTADKEGSTPESSLGKPIKPIIISRPFKVDEPYKFKWVPPAKVFPEKYRKTKIKIYQDVKAHKHHKTHKINVFFDQYNEFIRIIFKSQKTNQDKEKKLNLIYAFGLAKALGLKTQKDTFSECNLKSREHLQRLKYELAFRLMNKIKMENKDIFPTPPQGKQKKRLQLQQLQNESIMAPYNPSDKLTSLNSDRERSAEATPQVNNGNKQEEADKIVAKADMQGMYKYSIGRGNNALMVRSLFKNRFWWIKADTGADMERVNFMWTQIKNINHMETLLCKYPEKKSSIHMTKNQPKANLQYHHPIEPAQAKLLETKLYNKIEDNFHLSNKKALLLNMKNYYEAIKESVWDNLPVTFHIKNGLYDPEFKKFKAYYEQVENEVKERRALRLKQKHKRMNSNVVNSPDPSPDKGENIEDLLEQKLPPIRNIWILKPGENTNCGNGIQVASDLDEIIDLVEESNENNRKRTCIVQRYIHNPMLIHRRKFDIRTYAMVTSIGGSTKAFVYEEGYIRTSSYEYDVNNLSDRLIHLTNDAIQKKDKAAYGKYEMGNKMSYIEFQAYIDKTFPTLHICFEREFLPQMNKLTTDVFRATYDKLDPKRRQNTFEVFGLDFMIDDEFKLYLIEINTNPCLELSSPLLARMIPNMLENAFKLTVDPLFPPPENFSMKKAFVGDPCPENRFELIYDERVDRPGLEDLFRQRENIIVELDEEELSDEEELPDAEPEMDIEKHISAALMNFV